MLQKYPRWGFWMCYDRMRLDGHAWNHKRVYRVYKAMKLNLPRRKKRRLPQRVQQPMVVEARANAEWSLDFMSDALYHGRRFRTLNVLDEGVREALDIVIDTSIPGARVVRTLDRLIEWRGKPLAIRVDNGPELISSTLLTWAETRGIAIRHIEPGKPQQNAYIERYNRTVRHEWLGQYLFADITEVQDMATEWLWTYNHERPNMALGGITPDQKLKRQLEANHAA